MYKNYWKNKFDNSNKPLFTFSKSVSYINLLKEFNAKMIKEYGDRYFIKSEIYNKSIIVTFHDGKLKLKLDCISVECKCFSSLKQYNGKLYVNNIVNSLHFFTILHRIDLQSPIGICIYEDFDRNEIFIHYFIKVYLHAKKLFWTPHRPKKYIDYGVEEYSVRSTFIKRSLLSSNTKEFFIKVNGCKRDVDLFINMIHMIYSLCNIGASNIVSFQANISIDIASTFIEMKQLQAIEGLQSDYYYFSDNKDGVGCENMIKIFVKDRWYNYISSFFNEINKSKGCKLISFYADGDGDLEFEYHLGNKDYEKMEPIYRKSNGVWVGDKNKCCIIDTFYDAG